MGLQRNGGEDVEKRRRREGEAKERVGERESLRAAERVVAAAAGVDVAERFPVSLNIIGNERERDD